MSQESIHVYCYGFDAAGTPFSIFQQEKALNDKADREYFDRWQAIVRAIEDRLPVYCDLQEGPLPQWVDSPEN